MILKEFKNLLLVSGSGRNCGKTTVACEIISHLRKESTVIGMKITPHFHVAGCKQEVIAEGDGYCIYKENDVASSKDSSRMLQAGAEKVYFVQCNDVTLVSIYNKLKKLLPVNIPIVCESGSFANVFKPGLHILVEGNNPDKSKQSYLLNLRKADKVLEFNNKVSDEFLHNITFTNSQYFVVASKVRRKFYKQISFLN